MEANGWSLELLEAGWRGSRNYTDAGGLVWAWEPPPAAALPDEGVGPDVTGEA